MKRQSGIGYLDLFSGAGGFAKGIANTGIKIGQHYCSEIDPHAASVYQHHFRQSQNLGDVKTIKGNRLVKIQLLTFGSPCQDLSLAGKRAGLKGSRSSLFFEAVRLIAECRPSAFVFENVKGLLFSNKGRDFEIVLKALADLRLYNLQWQLLDTRWFLPQSRERIYLVGTLGSKPAPQIFPLFQSAELLKEGAEAREKYKAVASALTGTYAKGVHARGETYISMLKVPEATKQGYAIARNGDSINLQYLTCKHRRGRVGKERAHTITSFPLHVLWKGRVRRLTPTECERLQGFPDHWTRYGLTNGKQYEISDTQRYKMLGNAVSVPVVTAVIKKLFANI
jgi:DNA (cytosine-5)-methyltransferase 1